MRANFRIVNIMDLEDIFMNMANIMLDGTKMERCMDMANMFKEMEEYQKECGKKVTFNQN